MIKYIFVIMMLWQAVFGLTEAFAVTSNDIVKLKKAGVSDKVIKKIISSDAIARALISVDEIVEMKEAEIGDEIILVFIEQGGANGPELDRDDAEDRALNRAIKREESKLQLQKKEFDLLVQYLSKLITNPEIIKLVHEGKIASADYAGIVKYLKQYARDEETIEYGDEGDINIDVDKR